MTLSVRNGLLALALGILLLLAAGHAALAFLLMAREGGDAAAGPGTLLALVAQTVLPSWGGLVGFWFVRRAYRKSLSPELFFFALVLAALGGETLLLAQAWLGFQNLPAVFTSVLTRTVWAFRFTGLFLLVCASLFAFEFSYRKYGNLVTLSVAAGIFLAVLLPLHTSSARNKLLFAVGDTSGLVLVTLILAVLAALNFLLGALRSPAGERPWLRFGAALGFLASWTLAITWGPWGCALAAPAVVLAVWKADENVLVG